MSERLLLKGGTVVLEEGVRRCDVLVEGGRIAGLRELPGAVGEARVLDASGLVVLPGLVDLHVHLEDSIGRYELADGFPSGTEVAVRAGITTVCAFATQHPGERLRDTVRRVVARVDGRSLCDVHLHLTPTAEQPDWDELELLVGRGFGTVKLYTTYREAGLYTSWERLEEVMARLASVGAGLLLHCEDDAVLAAQDPAGVPLSDPFSHTLLRPECAEVAAIRRALALAASTGCRLHVVHVSTAEGASLIVAARDRGVAVTSETGPQYVLLDSSRLSGPLGHRFLCSPPLRSPATRERLEQLLVAGAVDVLATDHCPFHEADKDSLAKDYRAVPNGLAGLGALPGLAHELLCKRHGLGLEELARRLAAAPARVAGLYPGKGAIRVGADADLVVADPGGPARRVVSTLSDAPETWAGFTSTFAVRHVFLRGRQVVRDGEVLARSGRCLGSPP